MSSLKINFRDLDLKRNSKSLNNNLNMIKNITYIIFFFFYIKSSCQNKITINGSVKVNNIDSIYFTPRLISSIYYKNPIISKKIKSQKFVVKNIIAYPQMYFLKFRDKNNEVSFSKDYLFLDNSFTNVTINEDGYYSFINGKTNNEYKDYFKPFMFGEKKYNSIFECYYADQEIFLFNLKEYVKKKPDSFVALWFLIMDFNENGYSFKNEEVMNCFSKEITKNDLWKIFKDDYSKIKIKENFKFPNLVLKDNNLNNAEIKTEGKYVLVDFWFSRCKPCLSQIPKMLELFSKYKDKGFDILSISVDRNNDVDLWKNRIIEKEMIWKNYLDENGIESLKEKITSFPTNYILDSNGIVIKKNISLEDLDIYLKNELTN